MVLVSYVESALFLQGVALALSLHAPTQALRMTIVPTAETWTLDALMEVSEGPAEEGRKPA
jgi:adenine C2-methylase RlmN of 23S rRNA A2503 and tRNA A37